MNLSQEADVASIADRERQALFDHYQQTRALTEALVAGLSDADASAQSMPDASPSKWHLAHTTWFFETFVLREFAPAYRPFDERFAYLFNSYYEAHGARIPRASRGLITRPALDEVLAYRAHVDTAIGDAFNGLPSAALELITLGCHHEQQHQELLITDVLHLFAQNPLYPAVRSGPPPDVAVDPPSQTWIRGARGAVQIGHDGDGFAFDCECPRHTTWLAPHALASRTVTNAEWQAFIDDSGYERANLWLSDGWAWVRQNTIEAPLYWVKDADGNWTHQFGLHGLARIAPDAPVCHISYFEADAFARWAGARLPTEAEWESAATGPNPDAGTFLDLSAWDSQQLAASPGGLQQLFGSRWEWTASAFLPYPGFSVAPGAVGEYNGKFMSNQYVLRGGSCATPRGHLRASYRNFFYPHQRWQFTGLRLAKDI